MVDDARQRTKVFLETYLVAANMLKDDGATPLVTHVMYAQPDVPIFRLLYTKQNDAIFSIGTAESKPQVDYAGRIIGYTESVPIEIFTFDTASITGTTARWSCEAELRRIVETYPTSLGVSYRSLARTGDNEKEMGGWKLLSVRYILTYKRGVS